MLALKEFEERKLSALGIPGARLVFDDFQEVELRGELLGGRGQTRVKVKVVGLVTYIVLKTLAFKERCEPKDAYDLIYVLMRAGPEEIGQAFSRRMSESPEEPLFSQALEALRESFLEDDEIQGEEKEGPVNYGLFVEPSEPDERAVACQNAVSIVKSFMLSASGDSKGNN